MATCSLTKTCTKCGIAKERNDFHRDSQRSDGLRPSCKVCKNSEVRAYRAAQPEIARAYAHAWAAANPEIKRERRQAWRVANPEKARAQVAAYRRRNPDKLKDAEHARYHRNPEKEKARIYAYKKENPDKGRQHVQNRRAKVRGNGGKLSKDLSSKLFSLQKGRCPCCAEPLGKRYHLDHKMPLALGGTNTDDNMQLMRASCNASKRAQHPIDYMQSKGFLL